LKAVSLFLLFPRFLFLREGEEGFKKRARHAHHPWWAYHYSFGGMEAPEWDGSKSFPRKAKNLWGNKWTE